MCYCRNCGYELVDGTKYCPNCGTAQFDDTPEMVFCRYCGEEIDEDCVVCPHCGKQVKELKYDSSTINVNVNSRDDDYRECDKWVAFLWCFFFGFLGAHKFYEGKSGMGVLYIFTCGLFGLGWFFDLITILFKPNPYYIYQK